MLFDMHSGCFCGAVIVQMMGLFAMLAARIGEQTVVRWWCQFVFLGMLLVIGMGALGALAIGSEYGLPFGITLSIMLVGATLDLRATRPALL